MNVPPGTHFGPYQIIELLGSGAMGDVLQELPSSMTAIISAWQQTAAKNDTLLAKVSSDDLARIVDFYGLQIPLGDALWIELLDHIHHRGQFSVYLRLVGAKVPSIYGPTADYDWAELGLKG